MYAILNENFEQVIFVHDWLSCKLYKCIRKSTKIQIDLLSDCVHIFKKVYVNIQCLWLKIIRAILSMERIIFEL